MEATATMNYSKSILHALLGLIIACWCQSSMANAPAPSGLPTISLKAGNQSIQAEVAATDESRQRGLMFREKLARNEGMLFVFPQIAYHAMWMRNTALPLSVAFLDDRVKILSIHEMQPFTEQSHQAAGPARFALEMNTGWFSANRIFAGDIVKGLDRAPKPQ